MEYASVASMELCELAGLVDGSDPCCQSSQQSLHVFGQYFRTFAPFVESWQNALTVAQSGMPEAAFMPASSSVHPGAWLGAPVGTTAAAVLQKTAMDTFVFFQPGCRRTRQAMAH